MDAPAVDTNTARAALQQCLGTVYGEYSPAQELWDDEMGEQERRIFLSAARQPVQFAGRRWKEMSPESRWALKAAMLRFARRFTVLLSKLVIIEGDETHVRG